MRRSVLFISLAALALAGAARLQGSAEAPAGPGCPGLCPMAGSVLGELKEEATSPDAENFDWNAVFRVKDYLTGYPAYMVEDEAAKVAYAVYVASLKYGVSTEMLLSVIATESAFNRHAVSPRGAVGLMQIMPATGQYLAAELALPWAGRETLRDPRLNIEMGAYYLGRLRRSFGSWERALIAYNYGPGVVADRIASEVDFSPAALSYPHKVLHRNWPRLEPFPSGFEVQEAKLVVRDAY